MKHWHLIKNWLRYQVKAKTKYYLHSPFVYHFYLDFLEDNRRYYAFDAIENSRQQLLKNPSTIAVTDFGAGSLSGKNKERKISEICRNAAVSPKFGRLLFNLVHHYEFKNILELGTSLGIGTAYLASTNSQSKITSIEGCPNIADFARKNIQKLGIPTVEIVVGDFAKKLPQVLNNMTQPIDLAYLDGNHRLAPTLDYFEQILPHLHEHSIVVVDDIYWSEEMHTAWQQLQAHPSVIVSMDLFRMGLLFFHQSQKKENFILRF